MSIELLLLREINPETEKLLIRISCSSKLPLVRNRAKCIILSYQGCSIPQLMKLFVVSRRTIYNWLTRWESRGFVGLYSEKGRGRTALLSKEQIHEVKELIKSEPKSLKKVAIKIYKDWGLSVSKETIKRIAKKFGMMWKRMKRGLSKSPDDWEGRVQNA